MRILFSWLKDFVEIPERPAEVAEALTMAGLAVDAVTEEQGETVFDFDITANRPDAMNHFGVAREVAALYRRPLKLPLVQVSEDARPASGEASIEILDTELCPRYAGRVALGVEVKPSPDWISKRLELCGIRSINNIADLTNYVLLEIGHPTHVFDLDLLAGKKIIVRRAKAGETLCTLDGVERELSAEHLVIADARRPVALAGVMGGLDTEISDKTRNVLIESAWFQPASIRRTSRHFAMHTEASHRFERGADIEAASWAADRIAGLLGEVSPGSVLGGLLDAYPAPRQREAIDLRRKRIIRLLGIAIPDDEIAQILGALGFVTEPCDTGWKTVPPSGRLDVTREIDVIEELARIHGYDRFPLRVPPTAAPNESTLFREEEARLRATARALGYDETIAYSFLSSAEARQFGFWDAVPLRNPLSELQDVLRNSAAPSMLRALEWNLNRGELDVKLAEMGRLYRKEGKSYREPAILILGATGLAVPKTVRDEGKPFDFYELKADVAALIAPFDIRPSYEAQELPAHYLAGRSARVVSDQKVLAYFGEVAPAALKNFKIRQPVFLAEIFADRLEEFSLRHPRYRPLPRVPAVYRDFSLLVPEGIRFAEIRLALGRQNHLVSAEPVEIFRGKQVPQGRYSLLLRVAWRKMTESLTDAEVNGFASRLTENLSKKLGIEQRG